MKAYQIGESEHLYLIVEEVGVNVDNLVSRERLGCLSCPLVL